MQKWQGNTASLAMNVSSEIIFTTIKFHKFHKIINKWKPHSSAV